MSLESISSAATKELENDQLKVEKKNLEEEISRIGKHLDEIRRESSLVSNSHDSDVAYPSHLFLSHVYTTQGVL